MDSSELFLIFVINLLLLVLTFGLVIGFTYFNNRRKTIFSRLVESLEMLGFQRYGEKKYLPVGKTGMIDVGGISSHSGYYYAILDGKQYEVRFYAVGHRKFKYIPRLEFSLLGYFNARVSISTPGWDKIHPHPAWSVPPKMFQPGYDGLVIHTADENSAQFLLGEPASRDSILTLLRDQENASVLIAPKDIRFNIQPSHPDDISILVIQSWLQNLAEIAKIAAALSPLDPKLVYDFHALKGKNYPGQGVIIIFVTFFLLLIFLLVIFSLLKR